MTDIIIVFPKLEDGKQLRNLLMKNGFSVNSVCTTGAQAMQSMDGLEDGLIVCGYKLKDMMHMDLYSCLPPYFDMLLIASKTHWNECEDGNIVFLPLPIKVHDFIQTIGKMTEDLDRRRRKRRKSPRKRDGEGTRAIIEAKELLMERNKMTEKEAHRYIQKLSMDSGNPLDQTAKMIVTLMKT
ncbi:ANTAR domain-containing protein [bacterium 1XD42-8]|nr:ANTAR domain-containing protein [Lachnospiraceae bacterium]RKJ46280.1 ANTAR domain-containing protein [bacterium 1XD42-8]